MSENEQGFFSANDDVQLFYRFHRHPQEKAVMVLVHGHGEHSGRYVKFGERLKELPVSLASFDCRGTGQSQGREVYVDSLDQYVSDLGVFREFLRQKYEVKNKILLFGHSLGGLVSIHWALRSADEIAALFLSSPCLGLNLPGFLVKFNHLMNRLAPGFVYKNPVYPPHLSHNPEEVELYKKDPYIKRKISVRLLAEMLTYGHKLTAVPEFVFPFPVYILMAGLEKVVSKEATMSFFEKLKAPRKNLKVFDGFYHEIFNELDQEKAFEVLKQFMRDSGTLPEAVS